MLFAGDTHNLTAPRVILLPLQKSPKTQNNSWHMSYRSQRMIDRFQDFLVEYPVCVNSFFS